MFALYSLYMLIARAINAANVHADTIGQMPQCAMPIAWNAYIGVVPHSHLSFYFIKLHPEVLIWVRYFTGLFLHNSNLFQEFLVEL